jgi:hypothetical protein
MPRDELEQINDCNDLDEAIGEYQAGGEKNTNEERRLIERAVELGCTQHIPDDWGL